MGLFSKRKPATAASQASLPDELEKAASTSTSSEYVFAPSSPPSRANGHNVYAHPDTPVSSTSVLKIPFRRKRRQQQPGSPSAAGDSNPSSFSLSVAGSPATSKASTTSAISELDIPPPPRKSFVFSRSRDDVNSASTHSLPNPSSSHLSAAPPRVPSKDKAKDTDGSSGFFTWAIRERTRSKPSRPPPIPVPTIPPPLPNTSSRLQVPEMDLTPTSSDTPSSFNLKSFRHVRPDTSPPPASASSSRLNLTLKPGSPITRPTSSVSVATSDPASPSSLLPPARPRPRGDSVASDSSQRISVAAFREAQARRSQAGSPAPSMRPSAIPPTAGVRRPSMPIRRLSGSSSTSSESSSDESSFDHGDRKEATMARNSTITAKTSSTGLARRVSKSKSTAQIANGRPGMSLDTYSATRSSRSTSALTIDSAADDEVSKNTKIGGKTNLGKTLVDDGDSEDDAPLASLVQPRKSPAVPSPDIKPKPLIDINSLLQDSSNTGCIEESQRSDAKDEEEKKADEEEDEETLRGKPRQPQFMHRRSSSDHGLNSSISTNMPISTSFMYDDAYDDGPAPSSGIRLVAQSKFQAQTKNMATSSSSRSELGHGPAPGTNGRREPVAAIGPSYIRSGAKSELGHGTTDSQSTITLATSITPIPIHERKPPSGFSVTSRPTRAQQPQKSHTLQVEITETRVPSSSSKQRERASTIAAPAPSLEARLRAVVADASSSPSRPKARDASDNGISSSASSSVAAGGARASTGAHGRDLSTSSSSSSPSHSGIRNMSASYTTPLKPPAQAHGGSPSSSTLKKPLVDLTAPTQAADYSPMSSAPSMHARTRSSSSASEGASTSRKMMNAPLARPNTLVSLIPPSSISSTSGTTTKPWVRREDSPASSTGGSSSSRMPLTPRDGSEVGYGKRNSAWNGSEVGGGHTSAIMTRGAKSKSKAREDAKSEGGTDAMRGEESKRRERRRSEAMRAIELGNVINGRGSLDKDSDNEVLGQHITGGGVGSPLELDPRMTMMNPMMGMSMNMPMNTVGGSPFGAPGPWAGMTPSPSSSQMMTDPNFLAAHQQAMMIAKQAYQYAVAQQAMAAAADEWERGSAISGFTAAGGAGGGAPASGYFGQMTGFGGGMGWPGMPVMFPSSARSVYAGSAASDIGGGGGWGARSAYGETFGPADRSSRSSAFLQQQQSGGAGVRPPQGQRSESAGNVGGGSGAMARSGMGPRPRTTTAPSNTPLPPQHARANRAAPPSSWKAT